MNIQDNIAKLRAKQERAKADNVSSEPLHTWESPDWSILDDRRGALPDFPSTCLGKAFMTVRRSAKGAGVTVAHVAVPLLGIASGLIGCARRVQASTSWLEPMTMWCGVVGFSGTGKTPGLEVIKRALSEIEREKRDTIGGLRRKHDTRVENARAAREAWKKAVKEAIESGRPAPAMPKEADDPGKFIAPKLYVSDGTIERVGELLNARPQGVVRVLDELSAMFINMKRYSGGAGQRVLARSVEWQLLQHRAHRPATVGKSSSGRGGWGIPARQIDYGVRRP